MLMINMLLFHAIILLRKSDSNVVSENEKQQLKIDFFELIKAEGTLLPTVFCLEIFFKYVMFSESINFLFYRKDYAKLITLVRDQFNEEKSQIQKLE